MHYIFCYAYPVQWKLCLFTLYTSTKNMRRVNAPPRVNSAGENSTLHQTSSLSQYSPPPPLITQQSRFIHSLFARSYCVRAVSLFSPVERADDATAKDRSKDNQKHTTHPEAEATRRQPAVQPDRWASE